MADAIPNPVKLHVRNRSTVVQRSQLAVAFTAFLKQANNDLHKYWQPSAAEAGRDELYVPYVHEIREVTEWPDCRDAWRMTIYDYPYQAAYDEGVEHMPIQGLRSVGYHWFDGVIVHMVVFAALSEQAGLPWTLTFSHELLEALADPKATSVLGAAGYEVEICDPVQYDAYQIDGVVVSNFVTPGWFESHKGLLTAVELIDGADPGPLGPFDFAGQLAFPGRRSLGGKATIRSPGGADQTQG